MIDKLKVFEVAWKEFVEWMKESGYSYVVDIENFGWDYFGWDYKGDVIVVGHPELYGLAIEWLDSKKIYLTVTKYYDRWVWLIIQDVKIVEIDCRAPFTDNMQSRPEATEAGIIRAFEIYNQKEK